MRAKIRWLTTEEGGRQQPPSGVLGGAPRPYITIVVFEGESVYAAEAWSLVVRDEEQLDAYNWIAEVVFLVDEAPQEKLVKGAKFHLYEGAKRVADGVLE